MHLFFIIFPIRLRLAFGSHKLAIDDMDSLSSKLVVPRGRWKWLICEAKKVKVSFVVLGGCIY